RLKKAKQRSKLNWRNFCDISPRGPISSAWGINAWPSIFVLDHKGQIRYKCLYEEELDSAIDKLIEEAKAAPKK
ncbi:MAG: hypothetical protein P1V97_37580, partial [Planctomycetota bacterium]|nr:hypothetical protein [Planctomycetota bacterium]